MNRIYLFAILSIIGCTEPTNYDQNQTKINDTISGKDNYNIDTCEYNINASGFSPIDFMKKLRHDRSCPYKNLICSHPTSPDWVKKEDIPYLVPFLNSSEPAYPLYNVLASFTLGNNGRSTVGREAYFIINSYRNRASYPPLSTIGFPSEIKAHSLSDSMKNEILEWWYEELKKDRK